MFKWLPFKKGSKITNPQDSDDFTDVSVNIINHQNLTLIKELSRANKNFDSLEKEEIYIISMSLFNAPAKVHVQQLQLHLNFTTVYDDLGPKLTIQDNKLLKELKNKFAIHCQVQNNQKIICIEMRDSSKFLVNIIVKTCQSIKIAQVFHLGIQNPYKLHPRLIMDRLGSFLNIIMREGLATRFKTYICCATKIDEDYHGEFGLPLDYGYCLWFTTKDFNENLPFFVSIEDNKNLEQKPKSNSSFGSVGFINLGNTCYMNSVLQCLLNTPPLANYFLEGKHEEEGSSLRLVADAFGSLLRMVLAYDEYNPQLKYPDELKEQLNNIKTLTCYISQTFQGSKQQDALEFFKHFLDRISSELYRRKEKPAYQALIFDSKKDIHEEAERWSQLFKSREDSIIHDLFSGESFIKYSCNKCKGESFTFEPFWDLFLSFKGRIADWHKLEDMLDDLTLPEQVKGGFCKECNEEGEGSMSLEVWRLPKILTISFKRFKSNNGKYEKINEGVRIPVKSLDVKRLIKISNHESVKDTKYTLFAMIKHQGQLESGHYTAECRHNYTGEWYVFNDRQVEKSVIHKDDEFNYNEPYILMYIKTTDLNK